MAKFIWMFCRCWGELASEICIRRVFWSNQKNCCMRVDESWQVRFVCPSFLNLHVLGPVVQSWVGTNPGLKFNPLFKFLYFYTSVYFKTSEP